MRHFFQPKAGRSLPISSGLHVASGKSEGTGSCYLFPFSDGQMLRGGRADLFNQYVSCLEAQGEVDHKSVFIDGTKLESRAGRYTFTWRGTTEKNLEKVKQAVLEETGYTKLEQLEEYLSNAKENIAFVYGKGKRKTDGQR